MNSQEFANRFFDDAAPPNGPEGWWSERCPTGKHENPTRGEFGWKDGDVSIVMKCQKGCSREAILTALGLNRSDLRLDALTVADLARLKGFTVEYLNGLGVEDANGVVLIRYRYRDGGPAKRNQLRRKGTPRFTWTDGKDPISAYGLWRLDEARAQGRLFLVEGASDCWAGWLHGLPMLGLPGANTANLLKAQDMEDIPALYIVQEPGEGGINFVNGIAERLGKIGYKGLATVIAMSDGLKDLCELHQRYLLRGPEDQSFNADIEAAIYVGEALDIAEVVGTEQTREVRTKTVMLTGKRFEDLQLMWKALLDANDPPTMFRYGGALYKMRENGTLIALDEIRLHHRLITLVDWFRMGKRGPEPAKLDPVLLRMLLNDDDTVVPVLDRVVRAPVFSAEGRLVQTPGYDVDTGIYLTAVDGLTLPPVAEAPTPEDVQRAVELLNEMIVNFPFQSQADRATIIALLLLPFARNLIKGATPLHLIEAAKPGTGKSLLLEAISLVALGYPVGAMTEADNEEETRKRITAQLLEEPTFVVFENLNKMMRGGAVAQAITATTWKDRILGVNRMATLPVRCAWVAVANNPSFSEEVADRITACRIVADVERPRDRNPKQFLHPNLPQWILDNRGELVWACLTLIQNWIAQGRQPGTVVLGSFQSWAETMSGILAASGVRGLLENRRLLLERADPIGDAQKAFVQAWYQEHEVTTVYAAQLIPLAAQADLGGIDADKKTKDGSGPAKSEQTKMGKVLVKMVETVYDLPGGVRVEVRRGEPKQDMTGSRWRLVTRTAAPVSLDRAEPDLGS